MSLSTTSTTTYTLTKYSRAYPSLQTSGSQESDAEWQHFTNPVIRLVLDLKKSSRGELESYRLRVLWSLHAGQNMMEIDQQDVVFEDLDLLSFSGLTNQCSSHGLPLKAVYREAVVGIRYIHTRNGPNGAPSGYRRFQMNFQSAADATNFIEAVRHVCPCKANPPPSNLARTATMTMAQTTPRPRPPVPVSVQMPPPPLPHSIQVGQPLRASATMQVQPLSPVSIPARLLSRMSIPSLVTHDAMPAPPPASGSSSTTDARVNASHTSGLDLDCTAPLPSSALEDSIIPSRLMAPSAPRTVAATPTSIPQSTNDVVLSGSATCISSAIASTQPSTLATSEAPLLPANATSAISSEPQGPAAGLSTPTEDVVSMDVDHLPLTGLLPPLPKSSGFYDLPKADLEGLIAEVVREEGFVKLLESLDGLWRVKAYLKQ